MPLPLLDCLTLKRPPLNVPVCACPRVSSALTSVTEPFVVSSSDPVGTLTLPVSGTNVFVPLSLTLTTPWAAPATTVRPSTGAGGGSVVGAWSSAGGARGFGRRQRGVVNVRSGPRVVSVPLVATRR